MANRGRVLVSWGILLLLLVPLAKVLTAGFIWSVARLSVVFDLFVIPLPPLAWFLNGFILFAGTHFAFQLAHVRFTRALHVMFSISLIWMAIPILFWDRFPWNAGGPLFTSPVSSPDTTASGANFSGTGSMARSPLNKASAPVAETAPLPSPETQRWVEPRTGLALIRIPGGCFTMGSPSDEEGRTLDEGPQGRVCLTRFFLAETETTRGAFQRFVTATKYLTQAESSESSDLKANGCRFRNAAGRWVTQSDIHWKHTGEAHSDDHPVVCVTWNDANRFIDWLNQPYGERIFHLPSEAQWEYAARAGTTEIAYWGRGQSEACRNENMRDQRSVMDLGYQGSHYACDDGSRLLAKAGSRQPNPFGLFDMLGNVREWVAEGYHVYNQDFYSQNNPTGPRRGRIRMARGGEWDSYLVRVASRHAYSPDFAWTNLGFRVAMKERQDADGAFSNASVQEAP